MSGDWQSMRASHADRERTADVLKAAYAEGRLDDAEHRRRLDLAMRARSYGELQRLVADLPAGPLPFPAGGARASYPDVPRYATQAMNPWAHYTPPAARPTDDLAKASVILAVISTFTCGLTAVPAIVTGHMALSRIRDSGDDGRGMAIVGLCVGYSAVIGTLLVILFGAGIFSSF
ncbi:DUF1707 and DUF4190 domain-containing protein [Actinopolymorpha sp. B9G3]|uniref:DUF1707 and DUF4190 domain-containing protein n=1 Tax=Actinopolymorpha sp. B9G3 TaxID=3158970 RepID=UPI0032D94785